MVIERMLGERRGFVIYDVCLRVLLLMYVATLGFGMEWLKMRVNPGAFSGLPLHKKGSCTAIISGLRVFKFENKERNT